MKIQLFLSLALVLGSAFVFNQPVLLAEGDGVSAPATSYGGNPIGPNGGIQIDLPLGEPASSDASYGGDNPDIHSDVEIDPMTGEPFIDMIPGGVDAPPPPPRKSKEEIKADREANPDDYYPKDPDDWWEEIRQKREAEKAGREIDPWGGSNPNIEGGYFGDGMGMNVPSGAHTEVGGAMDVKPSQPSMKFEKAEMKSEKF